MKHTFSIKKAINFGWETFWKNPWFWVISWILVFGLSFSGSKASFDNANDRSRDYTYPDMMNELNPNLVGFQNTFNASDSNVLGVATDFIDTPENSSFPFGWMFLGFILGVPFALSILGYVVLVALVGQLLKIGWIHLVLNAARDKTLDYKTLLSDVDLNKVLRLIGLNILYFLMVFLGLMFFIIPGIYLLFKYVFASYILIDKNTSIGESFKMSAQMTKGNMWKLMGFSIVSVFIMLLGLVVFLVGAVPASIVVALASAYIYVTLSGKLSKK